MELSGELLVSLYRNLKRIRVCEESLVASILDGTAKCPVHLYSGEEAIAAGVCAALTKQDYIFGTHRSHGHFIAKGGSIKKLVAEIFGKQTGCCRGRGGSMHLIDVENGMMGAAPIVAGTISLATGAALKSFIRQEKIVSVAFFGDGATNEGVLFESMNFAALKNLPIIFVCENNFYSTHLPISQCRPDSPIFKMAESLGISNRLVDGNDVLKVYEAAVESVDKCRRGRGPVFLECATYRLRGHVGPDDNIQGAHTDIRPEEEIENWRKKDPIKKMENLLLREGVVDENTLAEISSEIDLEIEEAFLFARESAWPDESELNRYVFK